MFSILSMVTISLKYPIQKSSDGNGFQVNADDKFPCLCQVPLLKAAGYFYTVYGVSGLWPAAGHVYIGGGVCCEGRNATIMINTWILNFYFH